MKSLRHFLPFIILQFSFYISSSQQIDESTFFKKKPGLVNYTNYEPIVHKESDTVYYPYYNDVQMLRICHRYSYFEHPTFVKTDIYEYIQQVPVYLFRNKKGEILKRINTLGREISAVNLHHADDPHQAQWTHLRLKRNAYMGDPKFCGLWGIYPFYEKNEKDEIKVGLMDSLGNTFMDCIYESIEYKDSVFIVRKNDKYGLLDFQKNVLLEIKYDEIIYKDTYRNIIQTKRDDKFGLYWRNGKNFVPEEYDGMGQSEYFPPNYVMMKNGRWYFADPIKKRILPQSFPTNNVRRRENDLLLYGNNGWILVDSIGNILCRSKNEITEMVAPNRFLTNRWSSRYYRQLVDSIGEPVKEKEYFYLNKLNSKTLMGYYDPEILDHSDYPKPTKAVLLDMDGNQICDEVFDGFEKLNDKYLKAFKNGKTYLINDRGRRVVDREFTSIGKWRDHIFSEYDNGKIRFFNPENPIIMTVFYESVGNISDGRIPVKLGGKWGYIDTAFNIVIPIIYDEASVFNSGMAKVKIGKKEEIISVNGTSLTGGEFDGAYQFDGGFFRVSKNGKYGLMDKTGKIRIPIEYQSLQPISPKKDSIYGFIAKKDDRMGIIDKDNGIIQSFIYENMYEINGNNSSTESVREGFYVGAWKKNRTTIEYHRFNYNQKKNQVEIKPNPQMGFKIVTNGNRNGVVNWEGKMIISQKYDNIDAMKYNTFKVYQKGKGCGLMDTNGKILIPIGYEYLRDHYEHISVGKDYRSDWGLFSYDGKMIADTNYGGFDRPHMGMIPYYASYNHRIEKGKWIHDEKRVGLMDSTGKIVVEANYSEYRIPDQFKDEFLFINPYERILVNSKGELLERNETSVKPIFKPEEKKKNIFRRIFKKKKPNWK